MKKMLLLVTAMLLLAGCSLQTFETVDDLNDVPAMAKPATLLLDLPEEAAKPAMEGSSGTLYFCGDYDIMVEIMPSGDLNKTIQTLTGFDADELNLMQTVRCAADCYEGAWSAAGETGDQVGRVLVLDDSNFHYCVSVMAAAEDAGNCADDWNEILDSVALAEG
jgi:hypothetical protein